MSPNLRSKFTLDPRQVDWRRTGLLVLLVLAIAAALWQYLMPRIVEVNTTSFKRVPEIRKVRDVQRVYVKCPEQGISVLDKGEVAKRLHIVLPGTTPSTGSTEPTPSTVLSGLLEAGGAVDDQDPGTAAQDDLGLEILATGEFPESRNGTDVIAIIDMATGKTTLSGREKQAPWFRFTNQGAIGLRYGVDQRLQYIGNVYGKWDFLRVKDVYFSAVGDLETGGDAKMQLGGEYRW